MSKQETSTIREHGPLEAPLGQAIILTSLQLLRNPQLLNNPNAPGQLTPLINHLQSLSKPNNFTPEKILPNHASYSTDRNGQNLTIIPRDSTQQNYSELNNPRL